MKRWKNRKLDNSYRRTLGVCLTECDNTIEHIKILRDVNCVDGITSRPYKNVVENIKPENIDGEFIENLKLLVVETKKISTNYNNMVNFVEYMENKIEKLNSERVKLDKLSTENVHNFIDSFCELVDVFAYNNFTDSFAEETKLKKLEKRFDKKVDRFIKDKIKKKRDDDVNDVIRGAVPKASKLVKYALGIGAAWAISPALAVIGAITKLALDKKSKKKAKKRVLNELETELEICEEKIKDAEAEGEKKKKYQLMRAKRKLEKNIEKVKYNVARVD